MQKNTYTIKEKVWRWPGDGGWHFVTIGGKKFEEIRKKFPKGFVKVRATVGKVSFDTSLFPHTKHNEYLFCVNKKIRKNLEIWEGDEIKLKIEII